MSDVSFTDKVLGVHISPQAALVSTPCLSHRVPCIGDAIWKSNRPQKAGGHQKGVMGQSWHAVSPTFY